MTTGDWISAVGLVLDIAGAVILGRSLILTQDQALYLGVGRYAGETDEENLQLPLVQALLKQSRDAKIGLPLLGVGFGLQLVGLFL